MEGIAHSVELAATPEPSHDAAAQGGQALEGPAGPAVDQLYLSEECDTACMVGHCVLVALWEVEQP